MQYNHHSYTYSTKTPLFELQTFHLKVNERIKLTIVYFQLNFQQRFSIPKVTPLLQEDSLHVNTW